VTKLSVCITTFNNARTLPALLESVKWADEIMVLDSFSTDETMDIARRYGCRTLQQTFQGYARQKQMAIDNTAHPWVLLLDSDEVLSTPLAKEIQTLMRTGPDADGYEMPRLEQQFWRMNHPRTRMNYFVRLFDKAKCRMKEMTVHESPTVDGAIKRLHAPFYHYGEVDIRVKVEKLNAYSSASVADKVRKGRAPSPWILVVYPPVYFLRTYLFKRNFLNGWSGFITSVLGACYVFLKYAKLYEYHQQRRFGTSLMPDNAPDPGWKQPDRP